MISLYGIMLGVRSPCKDKAGQVFFFSFSFGGSFLSPSIPVVTDQKYSRCLIAHHHHALTWVIERSLHESPLPHRIVMQRMCAFTYVCACLL